METTFTWQHQEYMNTKSNQDLIQEVNLLRHMKLLGLA
jgi:hypothetical protein